MAEEYVAGNYQRQAQRFVCPLYMRDGLGGIDFSSTVTFVEYRNENFCVFAAHALPEDADSLENIGLLKTDGSFQPLGEVTKAFCIHRDKDVVVCNTVAPFEAKNYFRLDGDRSSTIFKSTGFGWVGFPKSKAKQKYHSTKATPEHIVAELVELTDGLLKWKNARFLLLGVLLESASDTEIVGTFENKNVTYEHEGFKQQGYSLRGMSGGAFFFGPEKLADNPENLEDWFRFAGIGLAYDGVKIKGVSRQVITDLLEKLLSRGT